jgi:hypothetical protein
VRLDVAAPRGRRRAPAGRRHGGSLIRRVLLLALHETIFENPGDSRDLGDGAYVFDPHGDLRSAFVHPCLLAYRDPLEGGVAIDGPDSVLRPGETMRVYVNGSPSSDSRLVRHWDIDQLLLRDGGDDLEVSTFDGIRLACAAWGDDGC